MDKSNPDVIHTVRLFLLRNFPSLTKATEVWSNLEEVLLSTAKVISSYQAGYTVPADAVAGSLIRVDLPELEPELVEPLLRHPLWDNLLSAPYWLMDGIK